MFLVCMCARGGGGAGVEQGSHVSAYCISLAYMYACTHTFVFTQRAEDTVVAWEGAAPAPAPQAAAGAQGGLFGRDLNFDFNFNT